MNRLSVSKCGLTLGAPTSSPLKGLRGSFGAVALGTVCLLPFPPRALCSAPSERESLPARITSTIKAISGEKSPAVVRIRSFDEHGEIAGTGFYIDPTGTICTLAQLVQGAHDIMIEQQGKTFPATLVASDSRSGIAFLKPSEATGSGSFLTPLAITNATELTPVLGIGYPREKQASTVLGMITGSKNHEEENYFCVTHLIASLPLSEGEGGSPVLDLSGKLIGMVIAGNTQVGLCTILPSAAIEKLHHDLLRFGGPNPGRVGAVVEIAAVPELNSLTRVVSVEPGSPADLTGIRPGDTLLAIGNHPIHTPEDVLDASFYLTAGESVQIRLARAGVIKRLTLRCAEFPPASTEESTMISPIPPISGVSLGEFGK